MSLNTENIIKDFPILARKIDGSRLVYLDNAATSQKPAAVIDAVAVFYKNHNANVHRGIHTLSEEATALYENARKNIGEFIGAAVPEEIVFTKGTTDSLNLVAEAWGSSNLNAGDIILLPISEHHSNLVPWQLIAEKTGAVLEYLDTDESGEIMVDNFKNKISQKVKAVVLGHASNATGNIFPVKEICKIARENGAITVIDGAQAAPHLEINMQSIGCDFYAFSGHKMLGPTGIGVLYAKRERLENLPPYQTGGGMIDQVTKDSSTWAEIPEKFEAGTPNIAGAIGLSAAVDYLKEISMENIRKHELALSTLALEKLGGINGLKIIGPLDPEKRTGLVTFTVDGIHAHDISSVLNSSGVAVRSGHHCTMPFHNRLEIPASVRASYYLYNTKQDIEMLTQGIKKAMEILG